MYRTSWSRLLAEFHFSTSEEATFWLFHPPGLFFNARHRCSVQENLSLIQSTYYFSPIDISNEAALESLRIF